MRRRRGLFRNKILLGQKIIEKIKLIVIIFFLESINFIKQKDLKKLAQKNFLYRYILAQGQKGKLIGFGTKNERFW